ncbi:MAG: serine hydrolase domain-containing protein [Terracidiphilus sp.]|jgi:CubicO group peptidase (beta-lactamase class C family)
MDEFRANVTMPDAPSPTPLPEGWTVVNLGDSLTVMGPETDLQLSFLVRPVVDDIADLLHGVWREIKPGFDIPILQKVEVPAKDGWDGEIDIAYDTPENESRVVFAIARTLGGRAYITLIDGAKAGFSRRMAQFSELHSGWKPAGLTEPSLAGISPMAFGDDERKALSRFVDWAIGQVGIPGIAIAVVQNGQTVFAEGFGVCKAGGEQRVTADTRFMIGSSTKPLTTMMMARLVDLGHFTWATPVTDVLPSFALADESVTRRLEMRHTVSASMGMPRRDLDLIFRFRGVRPEDRIAEMRQMSPTTGFGETFQYSNYLVAAGGYAAAHSYAHDLPLQAAYQQAMKELVFEPLGMTQTSVLGTGSALDTAPHGRDLSGVAVPIDLRLEDFAVAVAPAGSVWSNVVDMAQYLKCEMREGANDGGLQIISAENLLARRRPAIKIDGKTSYGLGWFLKDRQGLAEVGHGGNMRGFTANMFFLPEHRIGMVILTNVRLANQFLASVEQKLMEILFGAESKAEALVAAEKKALDDATEVMRRKIKTDAESTAWIGEYTGHYVSKELGPAYILRTGDGFEVEFEAGSSKLAVEQSGASRQIILVTPPWTTKLQPTDDPNILLVDGGQTRYEFVRVAEDRSSALESTAN